jgi:hypothetical protein
VERTVNKMGAEKFSALKKVIRFLNLVQNKQKQRTNRQCLSRINFRKLE